MKSHIPKGLTGLWRGRLVPDAGGSGMARADKTLQQVLFGRADANTAFADLRGLLRGLGFEERIRGDHHIFTKEGVAEIMNLQPIGAKAKAYQVRQVRSIILKYKLGL